MLVSILLRRKGLRPIVPKVIHIHLKIPTWLRMAGGNAAYAEENNTDEVTRSLK
jgi:hypothetical protein